MTPHLFTLFFFFLGPCRKNSNWLKEVYEDVQCSPSAWKVSSVLHQLNSNGSLCFFFLSQFFLYSLNPPIFQEHQNANLITLWVCMCVCVWAYACCCIREHLCVCVCAPKSACWNTIFKRSHGAFTSGKYWNRLHNRFSVLHQLFQLTSTESRANHQAGRDSLQNCQVNSKTPQLGILRHKAWYLMHRCAQAVMDRRDSWRWHMAGVMRSRQNRPPSARHISRGRTGREGEWWQGKERAARSAKVTGRRTEAERKTVIMESASMCESPVKDGRG